MSVFQGHDYKYSEAQESGHVTNGSTCRLRELSDRYTDRVHSLGFCHGKL